MITLRHIRAAEVQYQQRERERERENMNGKEKERTSNRHREKEIGILSMMGFDATSSFLAFLVNKSHRKLTKVKFKSFQRRSKKKVQKHFVSLEFCQVNHLQDIKNFGWPVMVINSQNLAKIQDNNIF